VEIIALLLAIVIGFIVTTLKKDEEK